MIQQEYRSISTIVIEDTTQPIVRGMIRWSALKQAERFVLVTILTLPFWWILGIGYLSLGVTLSIIIYEVFWGKGFKLKKPSLLVLSGFAFGLYLIAALSYYRGGGNPGVITSLFADWCCTALIIWYVQSYRIRVRLEVIAWGLSVLVGEMVLFWLIIQFALGTPRFDPPRSLIGLLTSKSERFIPGVGNTNYLMPYLQKDKSIGGLGRFVFFFPGPEAMSLATAFIALLSLDLKNRAWSIALCSASVLLMLLSGTRSTWIMFPMTVGVRYFLIMARLSGVATMFAVLSLISFLTLSVPQTTDLLRNTFSNTTEATSGFRADSTKVRHKIYERTIDSIITESDYLLFGHGVTGPTVLPGYAPAMIGSHSFLLGSLLYRSGLVGTGVFVTYWLSLISWFYQTRRSRPSCCIFVFLMFSFTFGTMELELSVVLVTLLCTVLHTSLDQHSELSPIHSVKL